MRVRVGTSGYSYKEWKGSFYPADLPAGEMLRYYAARLDTVEINNTFYRMPTEKLLAGWAAQVPEGFSLVLKATQRITHRQKLQDAGESLGYLLATAAVLGPKLGPMLFQLPPYFAKDAARLRGFLALLPPELYPAFEFRHPSWFDDEIYDALRSASAALVVADTDKEDEARLVPTASFGYLRLRRPGYGDPELATWAQRITAQPWKEAWVFFKHEDEGAGPALAERLKRLLP